MTDEVGRGPHLRRGGDNGAAIEALAGPLGGRVGVGGVLGDLNRSGRRALPVGRAVHRAYTWDAADRRTARWWPQGITTSADASPTERVAGRRLVVVAWYAREVEGDRQGCRVTFLDLDTLRYRHVLLVVAGRDREGRPTLAPLRVHAGGIVWWGPYLHVAATGRGFMSCHVDDLLRVPDDRSTGDERAIGVVGERVSSYGYRYLLPVRLTHAAAAEEGQPPLRYSFLSLDRSGEPPRLLAGEYGTGAQTRRLAHYRLDPATHLLEADGDGLSRPRVLDDRGEANTQGAVVARGRYHLSVSRSSSIPGSIHAGQPGAFRRHHFATPMGPEDLTYWPSTDLLWSVSEHPGRRWVFAMRRGWFDR